MSVDCKFIWLNGQVVPVQEATTSVLAHTLHYGLGAFEGIRAYRQQTGGTGIWMLDEHLDRLLASCHVIQINCPYTKAQLREACWQTVQANGMQAGYIRPIVFLGGGGMSLASANNTVQVAIAAWPWGAYAGEEAAQNGARLMTSSFRRPAPDAAMQRVKIIGQYANSVLAAREAKQRGFDEALLLDVTGAVAEGAGENIFVKHDGTWYTPPGTHCLPGITRDVAMRLLQREGYQVWEESFGRDLLYLAKEAFMTGTAAEITPIQSLDDRLIGNGFPGSDTRTIMQAFQRVVTGQDDTFRPHIYCG